MYADVASIIFEERNNNVIYYIRNSVEDLLGIKYNNNIYYYVKNIQKDIIGILDSNCNLIVKYRYDSWGNILSIKDSNGNDITDSNHIGIINPFRYRSYYYDNETNLYYLNSRYYSTTFGRFLNADGIMASNQDIMSLNLYAYCSNDYINNIDKNGFGIRWLTKLAINIGNYFLSKFEKVELASKMLNHSANGKGKKLSTDIYIELTNELGSSKKINEEISKGIKNSKNGKFTVVSSKNFSSTSNLKNGVGKADFEIYGYQSEKCEDVWFIDAKVYDTYDFDEWLDDSTFDLLIIWGICGKIWVF